MTGRIRRCAVRRVFASILLTGLALASSSFTVAAEVRTWADGAGQHQVKAKLVRAEGEKVLLQREDGTEIWVELAKLSGSDQAYVKEHASTNANPFQHVSPSTNDDPGPKPQQAGELPTDQDIQAVTIDWTSAKAVSEQPTGQWKFTKPDPVAQTPALEKALQTPLQVDIGAWITIVANGVCHRAVIGCGYNGGPRGQNMGIVLCDLQSGRVGSSWGPNRMIPLALSDSGDEVLMVSDDPWRELGNRLELWSLSTAGIRIASRWCSRDDAEGDQRDVKWGAFLPDGQVATFSTGKAIRPRVIADSRRGRVSNFEGKLVVWTLSPPKPLYYLSTTNAGLPALSPDRKHIAFATGNCLCVLDVKAGQIAAAATLPEIDDPAFAFSPSGARLAGIGSGKVCVWDFATGKLDHTIRQMGGSSEKEILWTSEDHVLVGKHMLFDVDRELRVWQYDGASVVTFCDGACWFLISGSPRGPATLLPLQVPHPEAMHKLRDWLPDSGFCVIRPGATVRLVVDNVPDAAQRGRVRELLAQKLVANGCKVGQPSAVELVASVDQTKPREVCYVDAHFPMIPSLPGMPLPPGAKFYTFRGHVVRLKFTCGGETIWEAAANSDVPMYISFKRGETIEQHLREAERPKYDWFATVEMPKLLTKTGFVDALGRSQLTVSGRRESKGPQSPKRAWPEGYPRPNITGGRARSD